MLIIKSFSDVSYFKQYENLKETSLLMMNGYILKIYTGISLANNIIAAINTFAKSC